MRFLKPLIVLSFGLSAIILISTIWGAYSFGTGALFMDEWDAVLSYYQLIDQENGFWKWLISKHMEHTLVLPRLQFLAEWFVFQSGNAFLITSILITQFATLSLLLLVSKEILKRSTSRLLVDSLLITSLFSATQMENFSWGFQVQFVQVYFFSLLSLFLFFSPKTQNHRGFAIALLFAVAAFFSMSNGILVFPLIIFFSLFHQKRRKTLFVTVPVFLALVAILLKPGAAVPVEISRSPAEILSSLPKIIQFTFAYIANPVGEWRMDLAPWVGLIWTSFFVSMALLGLWKGAYRDHWHFRFLLVAGCFLLGTALVTGYGRYDMGLAQAGSDRYTTPSILFCCISFLTGMSVATHLGLAHKHLQRLTAITTTSFAATYFLLLFFSQSWFIKKYSGWNDEREIALSSMQLDVPDMKLQKLLYPEPTKHLQTIEKLRELKGYRSIYSFETPTLPAVDQLKSEPGINNLHFVEFPSNISHQKAFVIYGNLSKNGSEKEPFQQAWVYQEGSGIKGKVFIVDGFNPSLGTNFSGSEENWHFYGHLTVPSDVEITRDISIVSSANTAFLLKPNESFEVEFQQFAKVIPTVPTAPFEIPIKVLESDQAWSENGHYQVMEPHTPLGKVFGSWTGKDSNTGKMTWAIKLSQPFPACILPFITGPAQPSAKVRILSKDLQDVYLTLEIPKNQNEWKYMVLEFPHPLDEFSIEITESGAGWGQWIGVAQPRSFAKP